MLECWKGSLFVSKLLGPTEITRSPPSSHNFYVFFCCRGPQQWFHVITVYLKWGGGQMSKMSCVWRILTRCGRSLFQHVFVNACRCMWRIEWFNFFLLVCWKTLVQLSVSLKQSHSHKHTEAHQSGNWFQMGLFHNGWAQLTDWLTPQCLTTWGTPTKRMSRIYFPILFLEKCTLARAYTHIHTHTPTKLRQ